MVEHKAEVSLCLLLDWRSCFQINQEAVEMSFRVLAAAAVLCPEGLVHQQSGFRNVMLDAVESPGAHSMDPYITIK